MRHRRRLRRRDRQNDDQTLPWECAGSTRSLGGLTHAVAPLAFVVPARGIASRCAATRQLAAALNRSLASSLRR